MFVGVISSVVHYVLAMFFFLWQSTGLISTTSSKMTMKSKMAAMQNVFCSMAPQIGKIDLYEGATRFLGLRKRWVDS